MEIVMKQNYLFKIISIVLCIIFTSTTIAFSAPSVYTIKINEEDGRVSQRYKGSDERVVVHVQDAHMNFDAQVNLANIICDLIPQITEKQITQINEIEHTDEHLKSVTSNNQNFYNENSMDNLRNQTARMPFIGIEGAFTEYDLKDVREYPIKQAREIVGKQFVKEGKFIGAELAAVIADDDFTLYGLEDKELFVEDFKAFYRIMSHQADLENEVVRLEEQIALLKEKVYSPDLQAFDGEAGSYEAGETLIMQFLGKVYEKIYALDIDLLRYVNLLQFQEAFQIDQSIKYDLLDTEIQQLAEMLMDTDKGAVVGTRHAVSLQAYYEQYKTGQIDRKTVVRFLTSMAAQQGVSLQHFYNITRLMNYWHKYAMIDMSSLMREIRDVNTEIRMKLAQRDDERTLVMLAHRVMRLKQLLALRAVKEDIDAFRQERSEYSIATIKKEIDRLGVAHDVLPTERTSAKSGLIDELLSLVDDFYQKADERDVAMVDNLIQEMDRRGQNIGVLVAGGYHSAGVTEMLKEKGLSYMTVTPQINTMAEDVGYMNRMMGNIAPIDPLYTSHLQFSRINSPALALFGTDIWKNIKNEFELRQDGQMVLQEDGTLKSKDDLKKIVQYLEDYLHNKQDLSDIEKTKISILIEVFKEIESRFDDIVSEVMKKEQSEARAVEYSNQMALLQKSIGEKIKDMTEVQVFVNNFFKNTTTNFYNLLGLTVSKEMQTTDDRRQMTDTKQSSQTTSGHHDIQVQKIDRDVFEKQLVSLGLEDNTKTLLNEWDGLIVAQKDIEDKIHKRGVNGKRLQKFSKQKDEIEQKIKWLRSNLDEYLKKFIAGDELGETAERSSKASHAGRDGVINIGGQRSDEAAKSTSKSIPESQPAETSVETSPAESSIAQPVPVKATIPAEISVPIVTDVVTISVKDTVESVTNALKAVEQQITDNGQVPSGDIALNNINAANAAGEALGEINKTIHASAESAATIADAAKGLSGTQVPQVSDGATTVSLLNSINAIATYAALNVAAREAFDLVEQLRAQQAIQALTAILTQLNSVESVNVGIIINQLQTIQMHLNASDVDRDSIKGLTRSVDSLIISLSPMSNQALNATEHAAVMSEINDLFDMSIETAVADSTHVQEQLRGVMEDIQTISSRAADTHVSEEAFAENGLEAADAVRSNLSSLDLQIQEVDALVESLAAGDIETFDNAQCTEAINAIQNIVRKDSGIIDEVVPIAADEVSEHPAVDSVKDVLHLMRFISNNPDLFSSVVNARNQAQRDQLLSNPLSFMQEQIGKVLAFYTNGTLGEISPSHQKEMIENLKRAVAAFEQINADSIPLNDINNTLDLKLPADVTAYEEIREAMNIFMTTVGINTMEAVHHELFTLCKDFLLSILKNMKQQTVTADTGMGSIQRVIRNAADYLNTNTANSVLIDIMAMLEEKTAVEAQQTVQEITAMPDAIPTEVTIQGITFLRETDMPNDPLNLAALGQKLLAVSDLLNKVEYGFGDTAGVTDTVVIVDSIEKKPTRILRRGTIYVSAPSIMAFQPTQKRLPIDDLMVSEIGDISMAHYLEIELFKEVNMRSERATDSVTEMLDADGTSAAIMKQTYNVNVDMVATMIKDSLAKDNITIDVQTAKEKILNTDGTIDPIKFKTEFFQLLSHDMLIDKENKEKEMVMIVDSDGELDAAALVYMFSSMMKKVLLATMEKRVVGGKSPEEAFKASLGDALNLWRNVLSVFHLAEDAENTLDKDLEAYLEDEFQEKETTVDEEVVRKITGWEKVLELYKSISKSFAEYSILDAFRPRKDASDAEAREALLKKVKSFVAKIKALPQEQREAREVYILPDEITPWGRAGIETHLKKLPNYEVMLFSEFTEKRALFENDLLFYIGMKEPGQKTGILPEVFDSVENLMGWTFFDKGERSVEQILTVLHFNMVRNELITAQKSEVIIRNLFEGIVSLEELPNKRTDLLYKVYDNLKAKFFTVAA